jgi:glucose/arabinose dehydrogenase
MPSRRRVLLLGVSSAIGLAGCNQSSDDETGTADGTDESTTQTQSPPSTETVSTTTGDGAETDTATGETGLPIRLETVTAEPAAPVALQETPNGAYYVADLPGRIHRLADGSLTTALDYTDVVMTGSERGLLGLALHPDFETNSKLYVRYSAPIESDDVPSSYSHTFVLSEFRTTDDGTIDPDSERRLLEIPEPQGNHNSGPIAFGPDGFLYVGVGDGGAGGDRGEGHVEDWYDRNAGGNGQDVTENLLGSLLRIDVDGQSGDRPYGIPDDNPLVGEDGLDEHYAWGLRNPWGISFDGQDLYLADVGQSSYEEVNIVEKGGNYGWNVKEGRHCYGADSCPDRTPEGTLLRDPIIEYPHSGEDVSGIAVVGGHVYRGTAFPSLEGNYVFGDLDAQGELFAATPAEDGLWPTDVLSVTESTQNKLGQLLGIAKDRDGELYALDQSGVHRLVPSS